MKLFSVVEPIISPPITVTPTTEVQIELREIDKKEEEELQTFFRVGCECQHQCSKQFPQHYIRMIRNDMAELSREELDLLIMGELMTSLHDGETTTASKHVPKKRSYSHTYFYHKGEKVHKSNLFKFHVVFSMAVLLDLSKDFLVPPWYREISI